ncbi:unnamed protein product [Mytilus coruscus]|uniref:Reverse transcriptase domain-containing protein n=1 Tax=Mytilus coruscus TaxID=42192 RepID=A0A6J8EMG8_MYTCO|nr:unnamed protein product [Mytilus coruscus]
MCILVRNFRQGDQMKPLVIPDEWKCSQVTEGKNVACNKGEKANFPKLPDHLVDLNSKSCEKLIESRHKLKLAEVMNKFKDAFENNKLDLGPCSIVIHKIDTAGAAPVGQPLRRTPQGFEGEEEKYLKDQLDKRVIVPSKSAYASGVVSVRKKDGTVRWCIDYMKINQSTTKTPILILKYLLVSIAWQMHRCFQFVIYSRVTGTYNGGRRPSQDGIYKRIWLV